MGCGRGSEDLGGGWRSGSKKALGVWDGVRGFRRGVESGRGLGV